MLLKVKAAKPFSQRVVVACLGLSLLLHLLVLGGADWKLGGVLEDRPQILETQLLMPKAVRSPEVSATTLPLPELSTAPRPKARAERKPEPRTESGPVTEAMQARRQVSNPEPISPVIAPDAAAAAPEIAPPPTDIVPSLPRSGRILFSRHKGVGGFAVGRVLHEWQHDEKRYNLQATIESTGLAAWFNSAHEVQTSEGDLVKGEMRPTWFGREREADTVRFDWPARQVTLGQRTITLTAETVRDELSMFYQLMRIMQRGERRITVATEGQINSYELAVLGEESLQVGAGVFKTWHVRIGPGGPDSTEVWFGKEVLGLPVLIRQVDANGDIIELSAEEIGYEGK